MQLSYHVNLDGQRDIVNLTCVSQKIRHNRLRCCNV